MREEIQEEIDLLTEKLKDDESALSDPEISYIEGKLAAFKQALNIIEGNADD